MDRGTRGFVARKRSYTQIIVVGTKDECAERSQYVPFQEQLVASYGVNRLNRSAIDSLEERQAVHRVLFGWQGSRRLTHYTGALDVASARQRLKRAFGTKVTSQKFVEGVTDEVVVMRL